MEERISLQKLTIENEKNLQEIISKGLKKKEGKDFLYEALGARNKQEKALTDSLINGIFDTAKILGVEAENTSSTGDNLAR